MVPTNPEFTRPASSSPIPWVGVLLLVACAAVSLQGSLQQAASEDHRFEVYADAKAYVLEHPYLEPGGVLEALLADGELERSREKHTQARLKAGLDEVPPGLQQQRQAELDYRLALAAWELGPPPAAVYGWVPAQGPSERWLSYPLYHASHWQLLGNGILLLLLAVYLEPRLGRLGFALTAVSGALAGGLAFTWALPGHERNALIGMAPVLACLWVTFALSHWRRRGEGFYEVGLIAGATWLLLPPWAGLRWSLGDVLFTGAPAPPTSVLWSLLGGALMGSVAFGVLSLRREPEAPVSRDQASNPLIRRALKSREAGRPREALEDLNEILSVDPDAYDAAVMVCDLTEELGRDTENRVALLRVVEIELRRGLARAAIGHWSELTANEIPLEATSKQLVAIALALREHGQTDQATAALRCALERSEDRDSRALGSRIARAARGLDPEIVEVAAWRALGSIELGLNERRALENLIAEALPLKRSAPAEALVEESAIAPAVTAEPTRPKPVSLELSLERRLTPLHAVPVRLGDAGIGIQTESGESRNIDWGRIEAVTLAAVEGLGPKHVMLIDLVLNWDAAPEEPLRVVRLRGDRYDPRNLVGESESTVDALRELMETILERSHALPLPDEASALGRPFASFVDLETYQRSVLSAVSVDADKSE